MKPINNKPIVLGVSGLMGSGKTVVAKIFESLGAARIDADLIGKNLLRHKSIKNRLLAEFGAAIVKSRDEIDTSRLAKEAFKDDSSIKKLNEITHPYLIDQIGKKTIELSKDFGAIVVDAALLPEWKLRSLDLLVVVDSPVDHAIRRACKARKLGRDDVIARMRFQFPRKKKRQSADVILPNYGSIDDLKYRAQSLFRFIIEHFGGGG